MSEIEITQDDREAAASFYGKYLARPGEVPVEAAFRSGHVDESPLIQAFARHRQTARERALDEAAEACEAQAEANARARVDRADDELAFEFRGLGVVIASQIRKLKEG